MLRKEVRVFQAEATASALQQERTRHIKGERGWNTMCKRQWHKEDVGTTDT